MLIPQVLVQEILILREYRCEQYRAAIRERQRRRTIKGNNERGPFDCTTDSIYMANK